MLSQHIVNQQNIFLGYHLLLHLAYILILHIPYLQVLQTLTYLPPPYMHFTDYPFRLE